MDQGWADKFKEMQQLLGKKATFKEGIEKLIELRGDVFLQITQFVGGCPKEAFWAMPFPRAKGYHSKTFSYSIWHIFRIEDIVAHELIANDEQIFYSGGFCERLHPSIITTGNELQGEEIAAFSRELDVQTLYEYAKAVKESSEAILRSLSYADLKRRFTEADEKRLIETGCVSTSDDAFWLIGYWCGKNVKGLLLMPFSRHWIMHVEAMRRIRDKLCKDARKGVDPIAYCGFSCNHCFLGQWCGSCRTIYNICSYATIYEDKRCPNVTCCQEKGLDGCYECDALEGCRKGFYADGNDGANAAKAQAMFVRKYGKKDFLKLHDRLHETQDFSKTQEILGQDMQAGFRILEKVHLEMKEETKNAGAKK